MRLRVVVLTVLSILGVGGHTWASPILQEIAFNVNGSVYTSAASVPDLATGSFDETTGLGTLVLAFSPALAGTYSVGAFFNLDLDTPFFDEYAMTFGSPSAGQTWQIDEPGYGADLNRTGTIYTNLLSQSFDNTNYLPGSTSNEFNDCGANGGGAVDATCNNDVSFGMGFAFVLAANQQAVITWTVSESAPSGGFYLQLIAPRELPQTLFLSGSVTIGSTEVPNQVPEPGALLLIGASLLFRMARVRAMRDRR